MHNPYLRETTVLRPFQKVGVLRMLKQKRLVLGDATGLGKTPQVFGAYSYYKSKFPEAKMIYLTDKSLIDQAAAEVDKFFIGLKTLALYELTREERLIAYRDFWKSDYDILIINYGSFQNDVLNPSSYKATLSPPNKGFAARKHDGLFGSLSVSQKGKVVYQIPTKVIEEKMMNLVRRQELVDVFYIQDAALTGFKYTATVQRLTKTQFEVKLECDGMVSTISRSTPFLGYWDEADKAYEGGDTLPMFCAFDEAIVFKETDSRNHKLGKLLSARSSRAVAITATVSKGDLAEAYNIFLCIGVKLMLKKEFKRLYYIMEKSFFKVRGYQQEELVGYKNVPHFYDVIQPFYLGRAKKDVAQDLPAFTNKHYKVEESAETRRALSTVYYRAHVAERPAHIAHLWSANLVPSLVDEHIPEDYVSPTMKAFVHQLNTTFNAEKVIVYINLKKPIVWMKKHLPPLLSKKYKKMLSITGDDADRAAIKTKFTEDPDYNLLLINSAGLKGLNLQVSGDIFPLMPPLTGGDYIQMAGRISRIGTEQTALTLHKIFTPASISQDAERLIYSELLLLEELTPNSVDEGLLDDNFCTKRATILSSTNGGIHELKGFTNRKQKYVKKGEPIYT